MLILRLLTVRTEVWSDEEDEALKALVELHGTGNWTLISQSLVERTGKQCRERFHNHLDVGIKKGDWTEQVSPISYRLPLSHAP